MYRDKLSNVLDQKISLLPLTTSINEFASAAKEVDSELKVSKQNKNNLSIEKEYLSSKIVILVFFLNCRNLDW